MKDGPLSSSNARRIRRWRWRICGNNIYSRAVELVQGLADHMFYVSSTRAMLDRVVSYVKRVLLTSNIAVNDDVKLSEDTGRRADNMI